MNWITGTIGEHGWAVPGVEGGGAVPPWAYSVGMWLTCQTPELVVCGAPVRNAAGIVNAIGDRDRGRRCSLALTTCSTMFARRRLILRPVDLSWRTTSMFMVSDEFYGFVRPPYLQVVWADRNNRFPWEPGFQARFDGLQPLLWLPRDDNPPTPWTRLA